MTKLVIIYLKKTKSHLFEFIETYRASFFLVKLNTKLKFKILNIDEIFNTREKILIKTIMQKKTLKRTRSNDENHFTQFKFFKNSLNKSKRFFNKFNNQLNSQFSSQREIDVNNQREIRDNIKRKRERDKIARFKNVICYDCNEKITINSIVFINKKNNKYRKNRKKKKKQVSSTFRKRNKKINKNT